MPGPETLIGIRRDLPRLGDQVVAALREAIRSGRLAAGTRLPSTRDLAADLGISRGLVVGAYEQLTAEGVLKSRRGAGTVVAVSPAGRTGDPAAIPVADSARAPTPVFGSTERSSPGIPPLRPGTPDPALFPRAAWRRAYHDALAVLPDRGLGYGDPCGLPELRVALARYLGRVRAATVQPSAVMVTTGASQALALLATALHQAGEDSIGIEDPGSDAIRGHFATHGLQPVPIPVDSSGLVVSELARVPVRCVAVTPAHQFPLGHVLAPTRRAELVAWARRVGGLVIEDDYDAEFRYDRDPVGTLQALGPDVVALVGTVSKALAPALRLGWVCAPAAWQATLGALKFAADGGGPALEHAAFSRFLASGDYDRHLRRSRRIYRQRRDATVAALRDHLPEARISGVAAGLHLVVELAELDDHAVADRARAAGLGPLPLSSTSLREPAQRGLLIGYAAHTPTVLADAIRQLAGIVRAVSTNRTGDVCGPRRRPHR